MYRLTVELHYKEDKSNSHIRVTSCPHYRNEGSTVQNVYIPNHRQPYLPDESVRGKDRTATETKQPSGPRDIQAQLKTEETHNTTYYIV